MQLRGNTTRDATFENLGCDDVRDLNDEKPSRGSDTESVASDLGEARGRIFYGGDGKQDAYHSDTERSRVPNDEVVMMGGQKRREAHELFDAI